MTGAPTTALLRSSDLVAFVSTTDPSRARAFYETALGLRLISESPFAVVFEANKTMLRVTVVERVVAAPHTVLGWAVSDISDAVAELTRRGVQFERYDGIEQDEYGSWRSPSGARVAWFKDPDGNILSLTQF